MADTDPDFPRVLVGGARFSLDRFPASLESEAGERTP